jgi:hypothetical protein
MYSAFVFYVSLAALIIAPCAAVFWFFYVNAPWKQPEEEPDEFEQNHAAMRERLDKARKG